MEPKIDPRTPTRRRLLALFVAGARIAAMRFGRGWPIIASLPTYNSTRLAFRLFSW